MKASSLSLLALPLLALLCLPGVAAAQPYLGLYLTGIPSSEHGVDAVRTFPTTGAVDHFRVSNARFGDSVVYGGLVGYQLIPRVAAELDVYHLSPGLKRQTRLASSPSAGTALVVTNGGDLDFTVVGLSAVWNYRLLPSEQVPDGRLQLYFGAGAALIQTDVDVRASTSFANFRMNDSDTSFGPLLKLGGRWFFTKNLGTFLELRWTHHSFTVEDTGANFAGTPIKLKAGSTVDIPLALVGLSWHFK